MNKLLMTFLCSFFAVSLSAQLVNQGGTIVVEAGATLFIESSLQNNASGSIDIQGDGIVQVEGDVTNAATITMSPTAKIVLSGDDAANFTSNGAVLSNVEMSKNAANVTLLDDMSISEAFTFINSDNKVDLGGFKVSFDSDATSVVGGSVTGSHFIADAAVAGSEVVKEVDADATAFTFHVGDGTNNSFLESTLNGTAFSSAEVAVSVEDSKQPNAPIEATDFINRYWNVDQTGVTDFTAALTGNYVPGDLVGTAGDVKGAHYSTDWSYTDGTAGANQVSGTIDANGDFTGTNSFGRASLMAFLDGPFSGGTMSNDLNTMDLLPTTSPYGGGETVAAGFFASNTDIVDWIEFETRNTATPATVEGTGVGFIKTDGSIVALDGVSDPFLKNAENTGYVVIKHRNHLAVCTGSSIDLDGTAALQDFSNSGYTAFGTDGLRNNGGTMTMWAGDVTGDGNVFANATPSDASAVGNAVLTHPSNTGFLGSGPVTSFNGFIDTYSVFDVNMDGRVFSNASPSDAAAVGNSVLSYPANTGFLGSGPVTSYNGVTAQIPN